MQWTCFLVILHQAVVSPVEATVLQLGFGTNNGKFVDWSSAGEHTIASWCSQSEWQLHRWIPSDSDLHTASSVNDPFFLNVCRFCRVCFCHFVFPHLESEGVMQEFLCSVNKKSTKTAIKLLKKSSFFFYLKVNFFTSFMKTRKRLLLYKMNKSGCFWQIFRIHLFHQM